MADPSDPSDPGLKRYPARSGLVYSGKYGKYMMSSCKFHVASGKRLNNELEHHHAIHG